MRNLLLGMTVDGATVRCRVELPDSFEAEVVTHGAGDFLPRERGRVQVLDDGE